MNCNECPMRYVCYAVLGGKDKFVYNTSNIDDEKKGETDD